MNKSFKILAWVMLVLTFLIILFAFREAYTNKNLSTASKIWLQGSYWVSFAYSFIFIFIFLFDTPECKCGDRKKLTKWAAISGIVLSIPALVAVYITNQYSAPVHQVIPSFVLSLALVGFDFIAKHKMEVDGTWKSIIDGAESLDVSVSSSLFVIVMFCWTAWASHGAASEAMIQPFSAGASAFSLTISTGTFSYSVIRA